MKTLFWNVDTQYDFVMPDGKLYVEGAETIVENLSKLNDYAHQTPSVFVVNTRDMHTEDSVEFSDSPDFSETFPPHCIQGTRGAQFVDVLMDNTGVYPYDGLVVDVNGNRSKEGLEYHKYTILDKDEFDVFGKRGNPYAKEYLKKHLPREIYVFGVATDVCVKHAIDGMMNMAYKSKIYYITDASCGIDKEVSEQLIGRWESAGVILTTTKEVINE